MEFNLDIFINNVYYLAKERNVKIGDLESAAGLTAGYLSRLKKKTRSSVPGISVIASIADMLEISIDSLISVDLDKTSVTDRFILSFLEKLLKMTANEDTKWNRAREHDIIGAIDDIGRVPEFKTLFAYFTFDNDSLVFNSPSGHTTYHGNLEYVYSASIQGGTVYLLTFEREDGKAAELLVKLDTNDSELTYLADMDDELFRASFSSLLLQIDDKVDSIDLDYDVVAFMKNYIDNT